VHINEKSNAHSGAALIFFLTECFYLFLEDRFQPADKNGKEITPQQPEKTIPQIF
jgi:hypothetical protein